MRKNRYSPGHRRRNGANRACPYGAGLHPTEPTPTELSDPVVTDPTEPSPSDPSDPTPTEPTSE